MPVDAEAVGIVADAVGEAGKRVGFAGVAVADAVGEAAGVGSGVTSAAPAQPARRKTAKALARRQFIGRLI
jgi:hypothetical protein